MKMRFWLAMLAVTATVFVISGELYAVEKKVRITGIYSDLYYNQEGGDLLGTEIFIVNAGEHGYVAFVQTWAGGTTMPLVVPVQVKGNEVTFAVPGEGVYKGRINEVGFDGTQRSPLASGGSTEKPLHLKRKKSYWQ